MDWDWIDYIIQIILLRRWTITWIVIGWLILVFWVIKPIHGWGKWKDVIRGVGEGTLGSAWAILCGALFHPIPGLSIMMFIAFGAFHWIRSWIDRLGAVKSEPRSTLRWYYIGFYFLSIGLINWYFDYDALYDAKRGIAQLTNYTVFADTRNAGSRLRGTGIRPSEPQADSSSWMTKILGDSKAEKQPTKQSPARSK